MSVLLEKFSTRDIEPYTGNALYLWLNLEAEIAKGNFSISILFSEILALNSEELLESKKYLREQVELLAADKELPIHSMSKVTLEEDSVTNLIDHEVDHMRKTLEFDASLLKEIKLVLAFSIRYGELHLSAYVPRVPEEKLSPVQLMQVVLAPKVLSWGDVLLFGMQMEKFGETLSRSELDLIKGMLSRRKELKEDGSIQEIELSEEVRSFLLKN